LRNDYLIPHPLSFTDSFFLSRADFFEKIHKDLRMIAKNKVNASFAPIPTDAPHSTGRSSPSSRHCDLTKRPAPLKLRRDV
jgi:hypothetical protein